jgi:hypothetical protein
MCNNATPSLLERKVHERRVASIYSLRRERIRDFINKMTRGAPSQAGIIADVLASGGSLRPAEKLARPLPLLPPPLPRSSPPLGVHHFSKVANVERQSARGPSVCACVCPSAPSVHRSRLLLVMPRARPHVVHFSCKYRDIVSCRSADYYFASRAL